MQNVLLKRKKKHLKYTLWVEDVSLHVPGDALLGKDVQEILV